MTEQLVAITGATGFLGRHVLDAVHQSGYRAVAVVRDAVSAQNHLPGDIEIRQADVMDAGAMEKAFRGVSSAIHLAGMVSVSRRDNQAVTEVNVTGARNFLMAVKRCGASRILFTSTTSAVAALSCDRPEQASDETAVFNLGHEPVAYIRAKRQAHELALDARRNGLPVTILSPSLVLGPGDINSNSSELVDAVRKRALPVCPPGGVNPIDVRDIARAYVAALRHPDPAPHYILASQDNMSLKKFISRVATLSGVSPPRFSLPGPVILFMATMVEAMAPAGSLTVAGARLGNYHWYFDGALARRDLSLDCRPLDDTLRATLDWLMAKENQIENKISQ